LISSCHSQKSWLDEGYGLDPGYIEPFPAPDIFAPDHIVATHHIALRLGKASAVAIIGSTRQLGLLSPHQPTQLILSLLSAVWTGHRMLALFGPFIKKITLFHPAPRWSRRIPPSRPLAILHEATPSKQESCIITMSFKRLSGTL
jgi:hypothetical protein